MGSKGTLALATVFLLVVLVVLGIHPALAESSFLIDVDSLDMNRLKDTDYIGQVLSSNNAGIRIRKYISNSNELAAPVRLTLVQMDTQTLIFDKYYDYKSGTFDSGDIYLPFGGNQTIPFLVTLYVGDWVYALPFIHLPPRLEQNSACTYGVRMRDFNAALTQDWLMGTMLEIDSLRSQGSITIPLCASNNYLVGQATVTVTGDTLRVDLAFLSNANVEVASCQVFCIRDVGSLTTADPRRIGEPAYGVGQSIDISGADTVLLYVPMTLNFDSGELVPFSYDLGQQDLQWQLALWNRNLAWQHQDSSLEETPQDFDTFGN